MRIILSGAHSSDESIVAMRVKCAAQGHNILIQPWFKPSMAVSRNRHLTHMTNMLQNTAEEFTLSTSGEWLDLPVHVLSGSTEECSKTKLDHAMFSNGDSVWETLPGAIACNVANVMESEGATTGPPYSALLTYIKHQQGLYMMLAY